MVTKRWQWTVAGIAVLVATPTVALAATPAQKCQSGKNKAVAKYSACRQKAEAKFVDSLDGAKRTEDLAKCEAKLQSSWTALEAKAVAQGSSCPSSGDLASVQAAVDQLTSSLAITLGGGSPPAPPVGQLLRTGQTLCYGDFPFDPISCAGTGQDGQFQKGLSRSYRDDGIGTVKDLRTGLEWEKLSWDGSVHDLNAVYTWAGAANKIAALNTAAFAGFTDWRLPNSTELASLANLGTIAPAVDPSFNVSCSPGCTVLTCSCTESTSVFWSSTSFAAVPGNAWVMDFTFGDTKTSGKGEAVFNHVRAVRGGV